MTSLRRVLSRVLVCVALVAGACGSDDSTTETTASTTETTASSEPDGAGLTISTDEDVVYFDDGAVQFAMDIHHPEEPGPWPLVIVYHGMTTTPANSVASRIAEMGAVAVAPQWLDTVIPALTSEEYVSGDLFDRAACATTAAQEIAGDYDADASQTIVVGFSAGIHPAGWVGLGAVRNDMCEVPLAEPVRGMVLGDSQFILWESGFDAAFADDASKARDTNARFLDPDRWNMPPDASVYLWTSGFNYSRGVEYPVPAESWIIARNATGTLVDDLEAVGAFDDGKIDWMDNALLMERRLSETGIEVLHESVGGGHNYSPAVYEGIQNLLLSFG